MRIRERHRDGVCILDVVGRCTTGGGDVMLRDSVQRRLDSGEKTLLLNLSEVSNFDSSGVHELVNAKTFTLNKHGRLKLLNLPAKVADILQITGLAEVFEIFEDEELAIASFRQ